MPDTLKFIIVLSALAAGIYGAAWTLANFPPEQTEITRPLPNEKLHAH
jgi:hypothetical protein